MKALAVRQHGAGPPAAPHAACAWRVSLTHFLQYRINWIYLYEYNYEFRDLGLMKCFRTAAVEADSAAEGSWDAEASVVLPLRFLGG